MMAKVYQFKTSSPTAIKEAWKDAFGGLILKSNDGDLIIVPLEFHRLLLKVINDPKRF